MTDDVITQLAAARTNPSIIMVVGVGGAGGGASAAGALLARSPLDCALLQLLLLW